MIELSTKRKTSRNARYHHGDLKRTLLSAAETELAEKGVEAFSLRGVAKRAGVSHAAPAHHFGDACGLLTELAANGYERFIEAQVCRQKSAPGDARSQLAASGLGYIDFATANPALFRLMFASERPDKSADVLSRAANLAFDRLVSDIQNIKGTDPYTDQSAMTDVMSAWAIAHGLADLMIAGRLDRATFLRDRTPAEQDAVFADIIVRAIGSQPQ